MASEQRWPSATRKVAASEPPAPASNLILRQARRYALDLLFAAATTAIHGSDVLIAGLHLPPRRSSRVTATKERSRATASFVSTILFRSAKRQQRIMLVKSRRRKRASREPSPAIPNLDSDGSWWWHWRGIMVGGGDDNLPSFRGDERRR
nr:hypothetical protein Itr_chr02CG14450 [Ipomoea trifida]